MPKFCAVSTCKLSNAAARAIGKEITLYSFPRDLELAKEWVSRCKRQKTFKTDNAAICSLHFKDEDFKMDFSASVVSARFKRLNGNAIPTLNLPDDSRYSIPKRQHLALLFNEIDEAVDIAPNKTAHNEVDVSTIKAMENKFNSIQLENQMLKQQLSDEKKHKLDFCRMMSLDVCRICLEENPEIRFTIIDKLPSSDILRVNEFLKNFTDLIAEENDGLPQYICWHCSYLTECALNLYKLCNESQKYFNEILTETPTVNEEEINIPDDDEFDINTLLKLNPCNNEGDAIAEPLLEVFSNGDSEEEIIISIEEGCKDNVQIDDNEKSSDHSYSLPSDYMDTKNDKHMEIKRKALQLLGINTPNKITTESEPIFTEEHGNLETNPNVKRICDYTGLFLRRYEKGRLVYQCGKCQTVLSRFYAFRRHFDAHLDPFYHCKFCKSIFNKQCYYRRHLYNFHTKDTPKKMITRYIQEEEEETKKKKKQTKVKKVRVPRVIKEVVSTRKPGELETNPNVRRIVDINDKYNVKIVDGFKRYECKECGKSYRHFPNMKSHYEFHMEDFYVCPYCQKTFKSQQMYRVHHGTHAGYEFKCDRCDKTFLRKSDLEIHSRFHTGERRYICSYCGTAFITSSHLITHERTHTGEKPYQCKQCNKAFITSNCLKKHRFSHMKDPPRPYICALCSKTFLTRTNLRQHMFVHYGKMFQCNGCTRKFTYRCELRAHMRNCPGPKY